jgi:hypothetical protein
VLKLRNQGLIITPGFLFEISQKKEINSLITKKYLVLSNIILLNTKGFVFSIPGSLTRSKAR